MTRWLICAGFLVGCDPSAGLPEVTLDPAIELGTGEAEFQDLVDGDDLIVIRGPQGGYHFLGSVRIAGIDPGDPTALGSPDNPTVTFQATINGAELAPYASYTQGLRAIEEDELEALAILGAPWTHEMVGRFAILDIADDDEIVGEEVRFEVRFDAITGESYSDQRTAWVEAHPFN